MRDASPAGVQQYLERYATPESALARQIGERYRAVLVVPAFREAASLMDGYQRALCEADGRVLVIVVVNAAAPHAHAAWPEHAELIASLRQGQVRALSSGPPAWLARRDGCDVLCIDRAHPDHCFAEREGVGLARRIGCDVALALHAAGRLELPFLCCTDADAQLPADYFHAAAHQASRAAGGLLFGFWHEPGGDTAIDGATAVYELGLRYYVAGLAYAGSPYAYHSLGSSLAVHASAYAAVRGFPRRLAGEDFYLLNKVAKVGSLWRADGATIRLRSRASLRTAHGTGVAAVKWAAEGPDVAAKFYHPQIFVALQTWLRALEGFSVDRDIGTAKAQTAGRAHAAPLMEALEGLGAWDALEAAAQHTRSAPALRQRVHGWFDAFRTLKLVHALRQAALPSLPFRAALAQSPFVPSALAAADVDVLRHRLLAAERDRPPELGPTARR